MSELTPRIRELLLELCSELLPEDDLVELARGGSRKGRVQRVASAAGAATYGVPIGTLITADLEAKAGMGPKPVVGASTGPGVPGAPGVLPGMPKPPTPSKPSANDVAGQFNADSKLKIQATVTHPRVPGAKVYAFSDGTGVIEDSKGNRSKRQKLDMNALKAKGWNVQEHADETDSSNTITGASRGDSRSNFEASEDTLKVLAQTTSKASSVHRAAIKSFEGNGPQVNAALRRSDEPGEANLKIIDGLRDLLSSSKTSAPVTVYRGMSFNSPEGRDSYVQAVLQPGKSFVDRGFTLASANQDQAMLHADGDNAENPGVILNVAVPKGSRAASLNAALGKDDQDHDVLLPDGGRYMVSSVKNDAGGRPVAQVTFIDPQLPAHERAAAQENPAITDEQKSAARANRFSWSPDDLELDDLPSPTSDAPAPPSAARNGSVGGKISKKPPTAEAKKVSAPKSP